MKYVVRELKFNWGPVKQIQLGMVTFGNNGYLQFAQKLNMDEIMRSIDNIVHPTNGKNTNTSGGKYVMRTEVVGCNSPNHRPDASYVAIVVTDGQSTWDCEKIRASCASSKESGNRNFSVVAIDNINIRILIAFGSYHPGFDSTMIDDAFKNNYSIISGSLAYSPVIEKLIIVDLQI